MLGQQRALTQAATRALEDAQPEELIDETVRLIEENLVAVQVEFRRGQNASSDDLDDTAATTKTVRGRQNRFGLLVIQPSPDADGHLDEHDAEFVDSMLTLLSLALERHQNEERERRAGFHDVLTGLPNRRLYLERVHVALDRGARSSSAVATLFIDLDHFKIINDTYGHKAGDMVLTSAAERIRASLRPGDTVARFGGDEFTVLCEELRHPDDAELVGQRIVRAFDPPFSIGHRDVQIGVSVGLCAVEGPHLLRSTPESMLRDADVALYQAKERGRGQIVCFDESMRAREVDRLATESDLRAALKSNSLSLYYQPLVELSRAQVVGTEALVRWNHAEKGPIDPPHFLAIAQQSALIEQVDEWVLEEATTQVAKWAADGGTAPEMNAMVMINVSARQLAAGNLPDMASAAVDKAGIDPRYLCFEIPESVLMHDVAKSMGCLTALSERGMCLAVDDFGTGYSSLSYLRRLPVDMLKIDRTFVQGLAHGSEDNAIVAAIINLAHTLGMVAVAEGVETDEQLNALRELQCDLAQGYYFSSALPASEIHGWDFSFS